MERIAELFIHLSLHTPQDCSGGNYHEKYKARGVPPRPGLSNVFLLTAPTHLQVIGKEELRHIGYVPFGPANRLNLTSVRFEIRFSDITPFELRPPIRILRNLKSCSH